MEITLQNLPATIIMILAEIFALSIYMNHFCTYRYNKYIFSIGYGIYAAIFIILFKDNYSQTSDIRSVLSIVLSIILCIICFKEKILYKILCISVMYFCNAIIAGIAILAFKLFDIDINFLLQVSSKGLNFIRFVIVIFQYMMAFLIMNLINRRITQAIKMAYYFIGAMIMYYSICVYMMYISSQFNLNMKHTVFIIVSATVLSSLFLFMAFRAMNKMYEEEILITQREDDYKHFKEQLKTMQNNYFEFRKLRHDFKDHLLAIDMLAKNGETDKLNSYIEAIQKDMNDIGGLVFCHNTAVNVIAASKYNMAKSRDIKLNISISIPENINVDDIYLCSLLSNILQNALENTPQKGSIDFKMVYRAGQLVIVSINDIGKNINSLETHKKDKENHGYGIKIIKSITETLDGNCILEYNKDSRFSVMINIPVQDI